MKCAQQLFVRGVTPEAICPDSFLSCLE